MTKKQVCLAMLAVVLAAAVGFFVWYLRSRMQVLETPAHGVLVFKELGR